MGCMTHLIWLHDTYFSQREALLFSTFQTLHYVSPVPHAEENQVPLDGFFNSQQYFIESLLSKGTIILEQYLIISQNMLVPKKSLLQTMKLHISSHF